MSTAQARETCADQEVGGGDAKPNPSLVLLFAITGLTQIGAALTLPSLPALRTAFSAPVESVQLTISAYFLGLGLAQIPYGALSDRLGRRKLLIAALTLFGVAAVFCSASQSLHVLIAFRALQGVGAAGCMVLSRVVIGDAFEGQAAVRMMSLVFLAPALVSLLGPLTGGWLLAGFGWRGVFFAIGAAGLAACAFALYRLPETIRVRDQRATHPVQVLRNCLLFVRTPASAIFAVITALASAGIYVYSSTSSFVLIEVFGVPSTYYGWFLVLTGAAMMSGSWVGGRLRADLKRRALGIAAGSALLAALLLLAACLSPLRGALGIAAIMLPMIVYGFCVGLFGPSAWVIVLQSVPSIAGMASAIQGTLFMGCGALFVWWGGILYDGTPSALGIGVFVAAAAWVSLYLVFGRRWLQ